MDDPFALVEWGHTVAEALRANRPPAELAARFAGRVVLGDVDAVGVEYRRRLAIRGATFWGRFDGTDARFGNTLDLSGCRFEGGLVLDGGRVGGKLNLADTTTGAAGVRLLTVCVRNSLVLMQARVAGDVVASNAEIGGHTNLAGLRCGGSVFLNNVRAKRALFCFHLDEPGIRPEIAGGFHLDSARIGDEIDISGIRVGADLSLVGAFIGGDLLCLSLRVDGPRPEVGGQVLLSGATVGGDVNFHGIKVARNIHLEAIAVGGSLYCRTLSVDRPRPEVGGWASLRGAKVGGGVDFSGVRIVGDFDLVNATISRDLNCRSISEKEPRPEIGGQISLSGARVYGDVTFSGVRVAGDLVLMGSVVGGTLFCNSHGLTGPRPEVGGRVSLQAAKVASVDFGGVRVAGDLIFANAAIGGNLLCRSLSANEPRPEVGGQVSLQGAKVGGAIDFSGVRVAGDLGFENAAIGGDLHCRSLSADRPRPEVGGRVSLHGAKVGGNAEFSGVKVAGDLGCENAAIGGDLHCRSLSADRPRPEVGGRVSLHGAKVGGNAEFSGVKVAGDLGCENAAIGGGLLCRSLSDQQPRPEVGGRVTLQGARVDGGVSFSGLRVTGDIVLDRSVVGGTLFCNSDGATGPQPEVGGRVSLQGAKIIGDAIFDGVKVAGDLVMLNASIGRTLTCQGVESNRPRPEIGGRMSLFGASFGRDVDLVGASVGQDLSFTNATIGGYLNFGSPGAGAARTEIGGNVILDGVTVDGVTGLAGAAIRGQLSAVRATLDDGFFIGSGGRAGPDWCRGDRVTEVAGGIDLSHVRVNARVIVAGLTAPGAVNLHDARVDGDLVGGCDAAHPTTLGPVAADNLQVGGRLDLTGVTFGVPDGATSLNLSFAHVQGDCVLPRGDRDRRLELYHARLGEVEFTDVAGHTIEATGLEFRRLTVPDDDYCRFLERTDPFQKGTYESVERYLRERGEDYEADLVYREMRRRDRRQELPEPLAALDTRLFGHDPARRAGLAAARVAARKPRTLRFWSLARLVTVWLWQLFLDVTTGSGTRSTRLGLYLVVVGCLMFGMFLNPDSVRREVFPSATETVNDPTAAEQDTYPAQAGKEWGLTESGFAALRTVIPLMGDLPHGEWVPSSAEVRVHAERWTGLPDFGIGLKYETVAGFVHVLSYVAVPLFLASATGWLKKRGE